MYADLIGNEGIKSQFLAVFKPRFVFDASWTLVSGNIYKRLFAFGEIVSATYNGTSLTKDTTTSVALNKFYYDTSDKFFYINVGTSPAINTIVGVYEIYLGTFDAHFNRDPLDNTTRVVYFEPLITKSPTIISSTTDSLFGFIPSQTTRIEISNITALLQELIYASSFNKCDVFIYHWLKKLETDNVKLLFKGICGNVITSENIVSINIFDKNNIFDREYRNPSGLNFYSISAYPNLDRNFLGRTVRQVYGVVEGFVPVNIDYVVSNPTTSDNRDWICINGDTNLGSISSTVPASPSSTTTRTYLSSANGFRVGDSVWIDSSSGSGFDEFVYITAVNKTGSHYIEHEIITNIAATGSIVKRSFVGSITIYKDNVEYNAKYGRDYLEYIDSTNKTAGFSFQTSIESNLSFATNLTPLDLVHCRIYGHKSTVTLNASPFTSDSTETGNMTNSIGILLDLLKGNFGYTDNDINDSNFISYESSISDEMGFAIPDLSRKDFPTYRNIFGSLSRSILLKIFFNDDNLLDLYQTAPIGAVSKTIEDDEIIQNSFKYDLNFSELTSIINVDYKNREISDRNTQSSEGNSSRVSATNNTTINFHNINKQKIFYSFHFIESEAQILANRLSYYFGDRLGTVNLVTKNRFFDTQIGDIIRVNRSRLLGYEFEQDVNNFRDFVVVSTTKSLNNITIELDDQKGIEDNSGSW